MSRRTARPEHRDILSADDGELVAMIPALRAFAWSLTRSRTDADDLVQETLLKALRHRDRFEAGTNLRSWLFTIMRNTFCTDIRKASRERPGLADAGLIPEPVGERQEWSLRGRELMAAVERLPQHYREILILVVMLGESYETSAKICGCAVGTVKSRVNRARRMVIEDLGDAEA